MMNSATDQSEFQADIKIQLPVSEKAQVSLKTTEDKVINGQLLTIDQKVSEYQLIVVLSSIQTKLENQGSQAAKSLLIIGNKDMDYGALNPILAMGARAGFNEFKFAVIREANGQHRQDQ